MGTPRKHYVRPRDLRGLTRAQLIEMGLKLFDRIESERLDPDLRQVDPPEPEGSKRSDAPRESE